MAKIISELLFTEVGLPPERTLRHGSQVKVEQFSQNQDHLKEKHADI